MNLPLEKRFCFYYDGINLLLGHRADRSGTAGPGWLRGDQKDQGVVVDLIIVLVIILFPKPLY